MKRRDLLAGIAASAVTIPMAAQTSITMSTSTGTGFIQTGSTLIDPSERKRQYTICKERGHASDGYGITYTNAIIYAGSPAVYCCKFCGTNFWTEAKTTEHESGAPE